MKFEQVLQIYWSKGFLYSGRVIPFTTDLSSFCSGIGGIGLATKLQIVRRFELNLLYNDYFSSFSEYDKDVRKFINILLSQINSVNNQLAEVDRYSLLRLYLIKSYRGKAQALGKPSRGQRTWSNGWTAFNYNRTIRQFVSTMQKNLNKNKKETQINFKVLQKKVKKSSKRAVIKKSKTKTTSWF